MLYNIEHFRGLVLTSDDPKLQGNKLFQALRRVFAKLDKRDGSDLEIIIHQLKLSMSRPKLSQETKTSITMPNKMLLSSSRPYCRNCTSAPR